MYHIVKNRKGYILYSVSFLERPSIEKDLFYIFYLFSLSIKEIVFSSTTLLFTKKFEIHHDKHKHALSL